MNLDIGNWISIVISMGSSLVLGLIVVIYLNQSQKKHNIAEQRRAAELKELEILRMHQMRKDTTKDLKEAVFAAVEPINANISDILTSLDKIKKDVALVKDGTLSSLRNAILNYYEACAAKGNRSAWDSANVDHLYGSYLALGGNSFIQNVVERFNELPLVADAVQNNTPGEESDNAE